MKTADLKTYTLRVSALGYETLDVNVQAASKADSLSRSNRKAAIDAWEKWNDATGIAGFASVTSREASPSPIL